VRFVGALVIVPFGSVTATLTVCDVMRPLLQAENGKKLACATGEPFNVTAKVPGSNVQLALSLTLIDPVVTNAPFPGDGASKASGPGAGKASPRSVAESTLRSTAIGAQTLAFACMSPS
jgi:hypothetical protein